MDAGLISTTPGFKLNDHPFVVDFFEIFLVREGEGTFHLNEEEILFRPGTVMFLPPGKIRRWGKRTPSDAHFLIFEEEFIRRFFKDDLFLFRLHLFFSDSPSFVHLSDHEQAGMVSIIEDLRQEIHSLREDSNHYLRSLLYQVLIRLNRRYESEHELSEANYGNQIAQEFKASLENNFRQVQKVQEYCELLGISKPTLNSKTKSAFGKTAGQMIRERVIQEGKQQLIYSSLTINEIAYGLNFSDPSNFTRLFKQLVAVSPGEFRERFTN